MRTELHTVQLVMYDRFFLIFYDNKSMLFVKDQETKGKEADPSHPEYRVQPGVIGLDHLELVALERTSNLHGCHTSG